MIVGLSANDLGSHERWIEDINEIAKTNLQFPIIADADREVAFLYDMVDQQDLENVDQKGIAFTIRSVFVIDPSKKIRLTMMVSLADTYGRPGEDSRGYERTRWACSTIGYSECLLTCVPVPSVLWQEYERGIEGD